MNKRIEGNTHSAVDAWGEVTVLNFGIVLKAIGTSLIDGETIDAYIVLVAEWFTGNIGNVGGIVLAGAQIIHTVHILRIVATICHRIILQSIGTFPYNRCSGIAEHILGTGAIVAKGAETLSRTFGQATHLGNIHTLLITGIEIIARATAANYGLFGYSTTATMQNVIVNIGLRKRDSFTYQCTNSTRCNCWHAAGIDCRPHWSKYLYLPDHFRLALWSTARLTVDMPLGKRFIRLSILETPYTHFL